MLSGPYKYFLAFLFGGWISGCSPWDNDSAYAPDSAPHSYFLAEGGAGKSIIQLAHGQIVHDFHVQVGLSQVSDMVGQGNFLWMSDPGGHRLVCFSVADQKIEEEFSIPALTPHHFSIGREYAVISDTTTQEVVFMRLRDGKLFRNPSTGTPGISLYNNGKFYVQMGGDSLVIYNEKAQAPYQTYDLAADLFRMQLDSYGNLCFFTRDSMVYWGRVDGNGDRPSFQDTPLGGEQLLLSPYFAVRFGTEFTGDVLLSQGIIQNPPGVPDSASTLEADFFRSLLFSERNDSLRVWDFHHSTRVGVFPFPDAIVKGFHYLGGTKGN